MCTESVKACIVKTAHQVVDQPKLPAIVLVDLVLGCKLQAAAVQDCELVSRQCLLLSGSRLRWHLLRWLHMLPPLRLPYLLLGCLLTGIIHARCRMMLRDAVHRVI